jgi:hypothetical protein
MFESLIQRSANPFYPVFVGASSPLSLFTLPGSGSIPAY